MYVTLSRTQVVKQTPPHLTSAAAEQILSQACDNEVQNAKRIRLGLEPLPVRTSTLPTRMSRGLLSIKPMSHTVADFLTHCTFS